MLSLFRMALYPSFSACVAVFFVCSFVAATVGLLWLRTFIFHFCGISIVIVIITSGGCSLCRIKRFGHAARPLTMLSCSDPSSLSNSSFVFAAVSTILRDGTKSFVLLYFFFGRGECRAGTIWAGLDTLNGLVLLVPWMPMTTPARRPLFLLCYSSGGAGLCCLHRRSGLESCRYRRQR
jgi:hypothetical protein